MKLINSILYSSTFCVVCIVFWFRDSLYDWCEVCKRLCAFGFQAPWWIKRERSWCRGCMTMLLSSPMQRKSFMRRSSSTWTSTPKMWELSVCCTTPRWTFQSLSYVLWPDCSVFMFSWQLFICSYTLFKWECYRRCGIIKKKKEKVFRIIRAISV